MHELSPAASHRRSSPISRRDAFRYAGLVSALGATAYWGGPTANAASSQLIDFAAAQIPAEHIKAAGYAGVVNYVSLSRPGSTFGAKPITLPYARSLAAAGLVIVSNYQYGKPGGTAPSDFTRGYAGGVADARTAWQLHTAAGGGQTAPVFFTIDEDISRDTWNSVALQWFRGINSVIGVQRTGVYGGIDVCRRDREVEHAGACVGLADKGVVRHAGPSQRRSLSACGGHRVESGPAGGWARSRRE